jgi:predicted P-loop ATPase
VIPFKPVQAGRFDGAAELEQFWHSRLILNSQMTPRALLANAITAFREAPRWQEVLCRDEFARMTVMRKPAPWIGAEDGAFVPRVWTADDDFRATEWIQREGIHVDVKTVAKAIEGVASEQPFHPVRDYLSGLQWDGRQRIETWLTDFLGVENSDYARAVGARWLISAVARVFQPGCKADCALIIEGKQGIGKSTALKILGGRWFTDELADFGSKDAAMQVRGVWIIEIAELATLGRSEVGSIKAFMSRSVDRFREPYADRVTESPRQCVFAGTSNTSEWQKDETGGRRFWPVVCTKVDTDALRRNRDQLWAEAVRWHEAGQSWWLETSKLSERAAEEQAARYQGDPWDGAVWDWIGLRDEVVVAEVLQHALQVSKDRWTQADQNRVARILKARGWQRKQKRTGGARYWVYTKGQ